MEHGRSNPEKGPGEGEGWEGVEERRGEERRGEEVQEEGRIWS